MGLLRIKFYSVLLLLIQGNFMWPGFGDNVRVLDWILKRVDGGNVAVNSPIGYVPTKESFNLDGLSNINWDGLFSTPKDFWTKEVSLDSSFYADGHFFQENLFHLLFCLFSRFRKSKSTLTTTLVQISPPPLGMKLRNWNSGFRMKQAKSRQHFVIQSLPNYVDFDLFSTD